MKKAIFFLVLTTIEVIAITFLTIFYYRANISVSWIEKNSLIKNPSSKLEYYYEPKPDTTLTNNLSFLGKNYNYSIDYNYNSDSLNQTKDVSPSKTHNVYRIVTLGDSFTFGTNLNTKDTYPSQLENILNNQSPCSYKEFEVLNFGVPGYDIQYSTERFRLRGQKYSSDLVIWLVIEDDLIRLNEKMLPKSLAYESEMKKSGQIQELAKEGNYYPDYKKARDEIIQSLGEDQILKLQLEYLNEFNNYYKNKLVLFTFPFTKNNHKLFLRNYTQSRANTYFSEDLRNIYSKNQGVYPDFHPNSVGANMIAQDIYTYLIKNNIISCD